MSLEDKIEGLTAAILGLTAALMTAQTCPKSDAADKPALQDNTLAAKPAKTTKAKAETEKPKVTEPVKVVEAEIVLKLEDVVKVLNDVAEISQDAARATLQECGVPEKDGVPKVGLLDPAQYLEVRDALQETLEKLNASAGAASFV